VAQTRSLYHRRGIVKKRANLRPQLVLGAVILLAGVVLVIVGLNASRAITDQVPNTPGVRFTQGIPWYLFGGLGMGAIGIYILWTNAHGKRT